MRLFYNLGRCDMQARALGRSSPALKQEEEARFGESTSIQRELSIYIEEAHNDDVERGQAEVLEACLPACLPLNFVFGRLGVELGIERLLERVHVHRARNKDHKNDTEGEENPQGSRLFVRIECCFEQQNVNAKEGGPQHDKAGANDADIFTAEPASDVIVHNLSCCLRVLHNKGLVLCVFVNFLQRSRAEAARDTMLI